MKTSPFQEGGDDGNRSASKLSAKKIDEDRARGPYGTVCIQSRKHVQKENTEKDIRKKGQDILFSEKQVFQFHLLSVWDLLRLIS